MYSHSAGAGRAVTRLRRTHAAAPARPVASRRWRRCTRLSCIDRRAGLVSSYPHQDVPVGRCECILPERREETRAHSWSVVRRRQDRRDRQGTMRGRSAWARRLGCVCERRGLFTSMSPDATGT
eukprot:4884093-Prymnesium_polylepis.1